MVTQIANQPITWQQLNAFRHLDVVKTTCWSSNRASEWGRKGDLSDFERGMVVGARRAGLSISKTADLLGFSHTTISMVYRKGSKKYKISSEQQLCGRKCLVDVRGQRRMGRLVRDDRKATVSQITTCSKQGMQNTISEHTQHVEPWSRWATATEDHTGCRSCQLRTGNGGYNSHRLTKIKQ